VIRANRLMGALEHSDEAVELERITDSVEANDSKRWPQGKIAGGKG
jgi:hypothetical protein